MAYIWLTDYPTGVTTEFHHLPGVYDEPLLVRHDHHTWRGEYRFRLKTCVFYRSEILHTVTLATGIKEKRDSGSYHPSKAFNDVTSTQTKDTATWK